MKILTKNDCIILEYFTSVRHEDEIIMLSNSLSTNAPVVQIGENVRVMIEWEDLINMAIDYAEKEKLI